MGLDPVHYALETPEFWRARQLTIPFVRTATSIWIPFSLLNIRNYAWDEWILKKIDQYQNVSSKYREVSGSSRSRSVVGGKFSCFTNLIESPIRSRYAFYCQCRWSGPLLQLYTLQTMVIGLLYISCS